MAVPLLTKNFMRDIRSHARRGAYCVTLHDSRFGDIAIDVFPYVFPPSSPFSESTHTVYDAFGDLSGKRVLDIGTGTGIQAVYAAFCGAAHVDAVDISDAAVQCAQHNVAKLRLGGTIDVLQSDMFSNIGGKYDLIIANLPILSSKQRDVRFHSLFDPDFTYHHRLFSEASKFLRLDGKIMMSHADLEPRGFELLERAAAHHGYAYAVKQRTTALGHEWRNYEFAR